MSFNRQILSGFAGNVDVSRKLVHAAGLYQMVQGDDVVVQGTGLDVLLPVTRPPTALQPGSDLTIDLLYIVQADTLPCTVQGGPNTINGAASIVVPGNSFCQFVWDGTQWLAALSGGNADGPLAGDVTGPEGANTVVAMQHNPIDPALLGVPDTGDLLTWTGTEWQAQPPPAPPAGASAVLVWGNADLGTTQTVRYLTPGYDDILALTETVDFAAPRDGLFSHAYVHAKTAGTGAETDLIFTLVINGVDSGVVVTMATTATDGNDLVNNAVVAEGDLIRIRVNKSGAIVSSPDDTLYSIRFS